jgi:hypothetical protein
MQIPADFQRYLDQKYDILGQEAGSGRISAEASARNAETTASLAPSAIEQALADAARTRLQTQLMPAESTSRIGLEGSQTAVNRATAQPTTREQLYAAQALNQGFGLSGTRRPMFSLGGLGRSSLGLDMGTELRFAKGTAKVPGKGDGTKDTVKAKLAPGEAVLNKAAAENMGRGLIAALNAAGARKMGMV